MLKRRARFWSSSSAAAEEELHEAHNEDDRKLQALGPMDGEYVDGVGVRVGLGRGRVVSCFHQKLQMSHELGGPVLPEHPLGAADDVEETSQVLELFLGGGRGAPGQPLHPPAFLEKGV